MKEICIICNRCSSEVQLFHPPNDVELLSKWKFIIGTEKSEFFVCSLHFSENSIELRRVLTSSAVPSTEITSAGDGDFTCACCHKPLNNSVDKYQPEAKLRELIHKLLEIEIDLSSWTCGDCRSKIQTFAHFQQEVQEKNRLFACCSISQACVSEMKQETAPVFTEILIAQEYPSSDPFMTNDFVKEEDYYEEESKLDPEVNIHDELFSLADDSESVKSLNFQPQASIKHRIKIHHHEFTCDICFKTYQTKAALLKHVQLHIPNNEKHNCDHCSKAFLQEEDLMTHINRCHSSDASFVCDYCENIFASMKMMLLCRDSHRGKKSEEQLRSCPICLKKMKSNSIHSHVKLVHNKERDQVCQVCGKALKTSYDLKVHLRIHSGERPEICETCGKTFISYAQLYKHRKIRHMIRENFQCSICQKSLLSRYKLKCHIERFHPGGLDNGHRVDLATNCYHCKVCPLKFIAMHKYEKHLKLNDCHKYDGVSAFAGNKDDKGGFRCRECGSILNTMKGLKKHIRFVHPKEPQSCTICSKQLKNPHTLWQHMTLSHKQPVKKRKT